MEYLIIAVFAVMFVFVIVTIMSFVTWNNYFSGDGKWLFIRISMVAIVLLEISYLMKGV